MIQEEMVQGMIDLIRSLPNSEKHIYESDGEVCVTNEWLVGNFAGRSFNSDTLEGSIKQLIIHCNGHLGHDSIAGNHVTKSGYPDLVKVKKYAESYSNI